MIRLFHVHPIHTAVECQHACGLSRRMTSWCGMKPLKPWARLETRPACPYLNALQTKTSTVPGRSKFSRRVRWRGTFAGGKHRAEKRREKHAQGWCVRACCLRTRHTTQHLLIKTQTVGTIALGYHALSYHVGGHNWVHCRAWVACTPVFRRLCHQWVAVAIQGSLFFRLWLRAHGEPR